MASMALVVPLERPAMTGRKCVYCAGRGTSIVPCSKACRIRFLLDRWDEIFDPSVTSPFGSPGDGSGVPLMPGMSRHSSVVELERCLRVLASESPVQLSHLKAYRCAEWRIRVDKVRRRRPHKRSQGGKAKFELVELRSRERIVPAWVRLEKVRRAEDRLVELFRGAARLPEDLEDALVLSTDEIEAKRRRRQARGAA